MFPTSSFQILVSFTCKHVNLLDIELDVRLFGRASLECVCLQLYQRSPKSIACRDA